MVREIRSHFNVEKFGEEMKSRREEIVHVERTLLVRVSVKNDLNAQVCELDYWLLIEYVTEMIVKTASVYVVGPRNTFEVHH